MTTKYINRFSFWVLFILVLFGVSSCEEYLDVAPEVDIEEKDVFGDFTRFQGYLEEMYQSLPDPTRGTGPIGNWNWSNDVVGRHFQMNVTKFEQGDYWFAARVSGKYTPFTGYDRTPNNNNIQGKRRQRGVWDDGWYGIRIANKAIENIALMSGTEEEKNLILGQAYFFRAYFHFAILAAWGGVPYVDKAFTPNDKLDLERLSYLETATRVAEDLQKAIPLLPADWDETTVGKITLGANTGRVTKGAAYGILGKNWLYAASPLMNQMETDQYIYNVELAKKAADAFNELLKLADEGYYGLLDWENYYQNFWTMDGESLMGNEHVWGYPYYDDSRKNWGEHLLKQLGGGGRSYQPPTLELANKFGMANGLPIAESDSGYDPTDPFSNRDPRFDYTFVVDREQILFYTTAFPLETYAQFYAGGRHREGGAITGLGQKKFLGKGANSRDNRWGSNYYFHVPYMRLAHAYLMYSEAANEGYGGSEGHAPGGISALEAVNRVRARAGVPPVDDRFLTGREEFRQVVRNEIGVEVALESHQWYDYRRWHISHLPENLTKSGLNYDENWTYFEPFVERVIQFDPAKHYWMPFRVSEVSIYPGFYQNPGW